MLELLQAGAAGLMALDAIGRQIGTRAIFEVESRIRRRGQRRYGSDVCHGRAEVAGVAEGLELVRRIAGVGHVAIHLWGVGSKRQAAN